MDPRSGEPVPPGSGQSSVSARSGVGPRSALRALTVLAALALAGAGAWLAPNGGKRPAGALAAETASPLAYVGSETCASCHQDEARLWSRSHHKLAMDHATEKSVLGDFSGATFDHYGVRSRFFRREARYFVETDGADGKLAEFEVKYTFGVYPLQQYLIEFPGGRLQALSIAWDSRPKDQGGQRWLHLYPERGGRSRRHSALDEAQSELEFHVRRLSLDRRAQEL